MWHYAHRFKIQASLPQVAKFHQDSRALKKLTPPPAVVQIHRVEPLAENSLAEFTIWLGPFPVHWLARHQDVNPETGFVDIQERGPFESWQHQHKFKEIEENLVEVHDSIFAKPGKGYYNGFVSRLMWLTLPFLFAYRGWVTRREVKKIE